MIDLGLGTLKPSEDGNGFLDPKGSISITGPGRVVRSLCDPNLVSWLRGFQGIFQQKECILPGSTVIGTQGRLIDEEDLARLRECESHNAVHAEKG
ncbi:MAG: hypothetical protein ACPG31_09945 [Planctomycetota bacterium]